jgi:hypothetical protein
MDLILTQIIEKVTDMYNEEVTNYTNDLGDISGFILKIREELDDIGVFLVKNVLEIVDELFRESPDRKCNWTIKSKGDEKTLGTILGEVKYKRTYYKNKKTGEYSYLSDEAVGIEVHDKLDVSFKAKLVEEAIFMPYSRSGEAVSNTLSVTSQTVMNSIRELGRIDNKIPGIKQKKKIVKTLFIEADEDHVALQNGKNAEPKLVYVHEGKKLISVDRHELINPRYFSGIFHNSDDLWLEVADYIYETYEVDSIEKIYLSGDGASWIKNGLEWIKDSIYVLDRYHLSKYVTRATAHIDNTTSLMWKYINCDDKDSVKKLFKTIIKITETETKKKSVKEARRYILGNWEGIRNQYQEDYVGCSAEGHVSHILSSRLSSRPLGWCETGVDQMARLRAFTANGGNVYELLLDRKNTKTNEAKAIKLNLKIIENRKLPTSHETFGNLAILNTGKRSITSRFLRSVRGA